MEAVDPDDDEALDALSDALVAEMPRRGSPARSAPTSTATRAACASRPTSCTDSSGAATGSWTRSPTRPRRSAPGSSALGPGADGGWRAPSAAPGRRRRAGRRLEAAVALLRPGAPDAPATVLRAARTDPALLPTLALAGHAAAVPWLHEVLGHPPSAAAAADVLGLMGDPRSVPPLIAALDGDASEPAAHALALMTGADLTVDAFVEDVPEEDELFDDERERRRGEPLVPPDQPPRGPRSPARAPTRRRGGRGGSQRRAARRARARPRAGAGPGQVASLAAPAVPHRVRRWIADELASRTRCARRPGGRRAAAGGARRDGGVGPGPALRPRPLVRRRPLCRLTGPTAGVGARSGPRSGLLGGDQSALGFRCVSQPAAHRRGPTPSAMSESPSVGFESDPDQTSARPLATCRPSASAAAVPPARTSTRRRRRRTGPRATASGTSTRTRSPTGWPSTARRWRPVPGLDSARAEIRWTADAPGAYARGRRRPGAGAGRGRARPRILDEARQGGVSLDALRDRLRETGVAGADGLAAAVAARPGGAPAPDDDGGLDALLGMVALDGDDASAPPKNPILGALVDAASEPSGDLDRAAAERVAGDLASRLRRTLTAVVEHADVRRAEAAWLGLKRLVDRLAFREARAVGVGRPRPRSPTPSTTRC